ncbi:translocation/assembly module TamB domain-containing protein [Oceanicola sp. 22II-s10i]|uniref:translocation/assembly module TamB domain-containing protein n=1 Tax=Oceanicola sp. 22II-s10i TaxID=1317116 RepID=UPI000B527C9A|nr:translocation/assembly module TamB domain-containing protein [Oceanicola sp. 22II-s10i]
MTRFLSLLALLFALALPAPVAAQSDDDGEGFLTRLIQDSLSSDGRVVDITGFRGALSSRATLERMTIADDQGVWLELNNAVLDWNRSALLSGRLEVNTLSAESVTLTRLPAGGEEAPAPEASGFAIPELPVSVRIGEISVSTVTLGESVIGEPVTLSLAGSAALADGGADVDITVTRTDKQGRFALDASYDPASQALAVNLALSEPSEGIAARLIDLPGLPSVDLTIAGTGPLDDYRAEIDLNTDGDDRLAGAVTLTGQTDGGRAFTADLGGDVTALFLPAYRDFFGPDIRLTASGTRSSDGALALDAFDLTAAAIRLQGKADISAAGQPERFAVSGRIAAADGSRVQLPLGDGISVATTTLDVSFDATDGDAVIGAFQIAELAVPGYRFESLGLALDGSIAIGETPRFGGDVTFAAQGIAADDPNVAQAIGQDVNGGARIDWAGEGPIRIAGLTLNGATYGAEVDADITPGDGTTTLVANGRAEARDLSAFAPLTGTDLRGAADLTLEVTADLLGGTFDIRADGATEGLALGIEQVDPLIAPPATLRVDASRTTEALEIRELALSNAEMNATASGTLSSETGTIAYDARLGNAGIFTGTESGPVTLTGTLEQRADGLHVNGNGAGRDLNLGIEAADLVLDGAVDFSYALVAGNRLLLDSAEVRTNQARITASGDLTAGRRAIDLTTRLNNSALFTGGTAGAIDLTATVEETGAGWRVEAQGGGQNIGIGNPTVDPLFAGRTDLTLALVAGERILLESLSLATPQADLALTGELTAGARRIEANGRLENSGIFTGGRGGPLDLVATAAQEGEETYRLSLDGTGSSLGIGNPAVDDLLAGTSQITLRAVLEGQTLAISQFEFDGAAVDAGASGRVSAETIDLTLNARLDNVARLQSGLSGPLTVSGDVGRAGDTTRLDLQATGPGGTTATVAGRVAMPDGAVDLTIGGQAPLALANAFIEPQSLTGTASFDLRMNGQPGLDALSGRITTAGARLALPELFLVVENLNGSVALGGGRADVVLNGTLGGGELSVNGPVTLSAPFNSDIAVRLVNARIERKGLVSTRVNADIGLQGPITGGARLTGTVGLSDTEMRIPSGGFGGVEAIPDITHVAEPAASRTARSRAGLIAEQNGGGGGSSRPIALDLLIRTDDSIFIRGRGLDAELRGDLRVGGTTADVRPVGQFDLVRGRLNILTKRLDLVEGRLRLQGAFEPTIRLVARNQGTDYIVDIVVEGEASAPEVTFSSQPELPQDEVLSQLFFDRELSQLSVLQAAKLAAAVAELTGSGDGGVVGKIRGSFGLDDLDVSQTADGDTSIRAGKYLSDNVYTDVEVTSKGETNLSINLDISDNVTARGKVTDKGDTSLGIFFQKDY